MTSGAQIVATPKVEGPEFVFRHPVRLGILLYRIVSPLFCFGFFLFVVWPDGTDAPQLFAAKIFFVVAGTLGGVIGVRQMLSFWSGDESFRFTCRVTSERIVKEYPSGRVEAGNLNELTAIEGGARAAERWWQVFRNPPIVLHFENGEKLTLVSRIRITHWVATSDYRVLLEKLGRLWQGNPIVDEWSSRYRQQTYRRHYTAINFFGISMLVLCFLFAADPGGTRLFVTLWIVVGPWMASLVYAFLSNRRTNE